MLRLGSIAGWMEGLRQDLPTRLAACPHKRPGFTLVAVLTLTLGIGGTATIFSAFDALLLRPLPYPDDDRLVALSLRYQKYPQVRGQVSDTDVAHWRADNYVFEQIESVSGPDMVAMSSTGGAERVGVQHVSTRLFRRWVSKLLSAHYPPTRNGDQTESQLAMNSGNTISGATRMCSGAVSSSIQHQPR